MQLTIIYRIEDWHESVRKKFGTTVYFELFKRWKVYLIIIMTTSYITIISNRYDTIKPRTTSDKDLIKRYT